MTNSPEYFMRAAMAEARKAAKKDEVPVGAVVVKGGKIIARGHNLRETRRSPLAHAELIAIKKAARKLGGWRLSGCDIYVTLEPCPMCGGAIVNARMDRVFFGASEPKSGAFGGHLNLNDFALNHRPEIIPGVLREECLLILQNFFGGKRGAKK